MKIGVVGAGAMGGILAAHLIKSGAEVTVIDVDEKLLDKAAREGLSITGPAVNKIRGEFTAKPAATISDISKLGPVDFIFVCVKTTVLDIVASNLKKAWKPGTVLISFQNGIDPEDKLAEVAGRDDTLRVVINYAGHVVKPCVYSVNWFTPPSYIGALTDKGSAHAEKVSKILNEAGITTEMVDDIKKSAFQKTAMNAAMCPVCTLTGQTMGEVMKLPETRQLIVELLNETMAIAEKMNWKLDHSVDDMLRYLEAGGPHKTSMAEDMNAGRKTEVVYMNGKVCDYGKKLGVPTPYNNAMRIAVLGKEQQIGK